MFAQNKRDIAAELNDLFASFDMLNLRSFGYGHSFGVLSHYYGREEGLELREDIDTVLEPGMVRSMFERQIVKDHLETQVVSMEPMITVADGLPGAGGFQSYQDHDNQIFKTTKVVMMFRFPKNTRFIHKTHKNHNSI